MSSVNCKSQRYATTLWSIFQSIIQREHMSHASRGHVTYAAASVYTNRLYPCSTHSHETHRTASCTIIHYVPLQRRRWKRPKWRDLRALRPYRLRSTMIRIILFCSGARPCALSHGAHAPRSKRDTHRGYGERTCPFFNVFTPFTLCTHNHVAYNRKSRSADDRNRHLSMPFRRRSIHSCHRLARIGFWRIVTRWR